MNSLVLLAGIEPPTEISTYVGGLFLAALVPELFRRIFSRNDAVAATATKAEADWKAEVKSDLKRALELLNDEKHARGLMARDFAALEGKFAALEKRQDAQAAAHLEAIKQLKGHA